MKSTTKDYCQVMRTPQIYDVNHLTNLLDQFYPRMLSQIDRDPTSPTYGSCDRHFWMYRLNDFDSGVLQQGSLTLALLVALADYTDFSDCRYLNISHLPYWKTLAKAINTRTIALLGNKGALDEYFPGEASFPATVFSAYAALKSAVLLQQDEVVRSSNLRAVAERIINKNPSPAANQDTAAAAFITLYAKANDWKIKEAENAAQQLLSVNGTPRDFLEYGGADLGYASVTLNYLAYMDQDKTHPTRNHLLQLGEFITEFVTPSGNIGGEFASRSTTYLLPFGLIRTAFLSPQLAGRFDGIDIQRAFEKLDDRYLMHYCLPSLAASALELAQNGVPQFDADTKTQSWSNRLYSDFQLHSSRKGHTTVFIGINKGGAFHIEDMAQTYVDCGYRIERKGRIYATCIVNENPEFSVDQTDKRLLLTVKVPFKRYKTIMASSTKTIALRMLRLFGPVINAYMKRSLISNPKELKGVFLERTLDLDLHGDTLIVRDTFRGITTEDNLSLSAPSSLRLVPSARFFQSGEEEAFMRIDGTEIDSKGYTRTFNLCLPPVRIEAGEPVTSRP